MWSTTTRACAVLLAGLLAQGCYSSSDSLTGGDASDAPHDPVPDVLPDGPVDPLPDPVPPDVGPDLAPDPLPDVAPDPGPDPWPDVPPDIVDADWVDVPPGGIVGDACSGRSDCRGIPSTSADCWWDILGFLRFPGGYCSASCYADWECGPEGECVDLSFVALCLRTCDYDEDCRLSEGYECMDLPWVGGGPYCLPRG